MLAPSPRKLAAEVLASPHWNGRSSAADHLGASSDNGPACDCSKLMDSGGDASSVLADYVGNVPSPSLEKTTEQVLREAANRAMERKQKETLGGAQLDDTGDNLTAVEEEDFIVDADGNFKFVPKRKTMLARAGETTSDAAEPRRHGSLFARFRRGGSTRRAEDTKKGDEALVQTRRLNESEAPSHPFRYKMWKLQRRKTFRIVLLLCVLGSAYSLASEYPSDTDGNKERDYRYVEISLNAAFTFEFVVKYIAFGKQYFNSGWNLLDFTVALNSWAIILISYFAPARFANSLKSLNLMRVLRPLRALSLVPALREIINALALAVQDLRSTLILVMFFLLVFSTALSALFAGNLRYRCYDDALKQFYEDPSLICSVLPGVGRQCLRPNSTCVDSGFGPYANLDGLAPHYLSEHGHEARPVDANPPYVISLDSFGWAVLVVFQVWAGVGWTTIMYYIGDSLGRGYEGFFILMHISGAWFLVNLVVAVLGASFEKEALRLKKVKEEQEREREKRTDKKLSWWQRARQMLWNLRSMGQSETETATRQASPPPSPPSISSQPADLNEKSGARFVPRRVRLAEAATNLGELATGVDLDGDGDVGDVWRRGASAPQISTDWKPGHVVEGGDDDAQESNEEGDNEKKRAGVKQLAASIVNRLWFQFLVLASIAASTILTAVDGPFVKAKFGRASDEAMLDYFNWLFGSLFLVEGIVKITALGLFEYLATSKLNWIDLTTNVVFVIEQTLSAMGFPVGGYIVAVKAFRLTRVFKLGLAIPAFRSLVTKMVVSITEVSSMLLLMLFLLFFISVACLHLFHDMYDPMYGGSCVPASLGGTAEQLHSQACAQKPRHHFDGIAVAYITAFQVMTTDNWIAVMWDTYRASGTPALGIFPMVIVVGNFIVLNVFLAILLSTFAAAAKEEALQANLEAEKETQEVQEAAKAAARVTHNAEFLLASGSLSAKKRAETNRKIREQQEALRQEGSLSLVSPVHPPSGSPQLNIVPLAETTLACSNQSPAPSSPGEMNLAAAAAAVLGPDRTLQATKVFIDHDVDGSGEIDVDELRNALVDLGLENDDALIEQIMARYDLDGNKTLDLPEFLMLVRDTPPAPPYRLARILHSLLPQPIKESPWMKLWIQNASARYAQRMRKLAAARGEHARRMRKLRRSKMRARTGKYGSLNAWETAYFRGAFDKADIDGDGHLVLYEVYQLLMELDEEPQTNDTWEVLDANASSDDLVSKDEFLVFISLKRADDAEIAKRGVTIQESAVQQAMRKEANQKRAQMKLSMARNRNRRWKVLKRLTSRLQIALRRVYLDRLPNLGTFGKDGLGEDRARFLQRVIYSRYFWLIQVVLIVASAILVTSEIDVFIRSVRLHAGMPSASSDATTPRYVVAIFDSAFMLMTLGEIITKVLVEGLLQTFSSPWNVLDAMCLFFSVLRLLVGTEGLRLLLSFSSLRVFMLVPRFKELKVLFQSVLRALPNVTVTLSSLMVIWLMFAILGVNLFGGASHQCARLSDTSGYPGCGVDFGSLSYDSPIGCRYARNPLPPPPEVIPGVTNSTMCGCTWDGGVRTCSIINGTDNHQLAWVPAFPNFDTTGEALLALLQISTVDGWSSIMYFGMDVTKVDHQPAREMDYLAPLVFYLTFIIFGVLFATNVFVGVVIDEFNRIIRHYEGCVVCQCSS